MSQPGKHRRHLPSNRHKRRIRGFPCWAGRRCCKRVHTATERWLAPSLPSAPDWHCRLKFQWQNYANDSLDGRINALVTDGHRNAVTLLRKKIRLWLKLGLTSSLIHFRFRQSLNFPAGLQSARLSGMCGSCCEIQLAILDNKTLEVERSLS